MTQTALDFDATPAPEPAAALPAELIEVFGEPISVYTRAQAIADGELVDVSQWARETGITAPTVFTRALWALVDIDTKKAANRATPRERIEDTRGRAHDVLWLARTYGRVAAGHRFGFVVKFACRNYRVQVVLDGDGITIGFPSDF